MARPFSISHSPISHTASAGIVGQMTGFGFDFVGRGILFTLLDPNKEGLSLLMALLQGAVDEADILGNEMERLEKPESLMMS